MLAQELNTQFELAKMMMRQFPNKVREYTAQSNNQRSQENEMSAHASIYTFLHPFTSTFERK